MQSRENGFIESFNGQTRGQLLNGEIFTTLLEAKVLVEDWRQAVQPISQLILTQQLVQLLGPGHNHPGNFDR